MVTAVLLTVATSQAAAAPAGVTGAVSVSVLDKSGAMVTDLAVEARQVEVKASRKGAKVRVRPAGLS